VNKPKNHRQRSARARGLRTLQHQTLPPATRYAIDTEVWFRSFVAESEDGRGHDPGWPTKDQVHDEAIGWFLDRHAQRPFEHYPARRAQDEDLTFWVDSKLMQRARRMATRDGVKVARLIDAALSAYARAHVPEGLTGFRRRVQVAATRLYLSKHRRRARSRKR